MFIVFGGFTGCELFRNMVEFCNLAKIIAEVCNLAQDYSGVVTIWSGL